MREAGPDAAPIVVLLHGFPLNSAMWMPQIEALEPEWRVIAPDARGVGSSDLGHGQYTMELLVDDLFAVLDGTAEGRPVVAVGLSMGGYILLRAMEREPDRFRGVVLCDTRSVADGDEGKLGRAEAIRRIREQGVALFAGGFLEQLVAPDTSRRRPELVDDLRRMILSNSPAGITGLLLAMVSRTDTTASLSRIEIPALVVVGSEDRLTPPGQAREMADRIPEARYSEIAGAGHLSNVESSDEFNRSLLDFLSSV